MPGFDQTGPIGQGSMSGGGRGYCSLANRGYRRLPEGEFGLGRRLRGRLFRGGFGPGQGRGFQRGMGRPASVNSTASADELSLLKEEARDAGLGLEALMEKITALEKQMTSV